MGHKTADTLSMMNLFFALCSVVFFCGCAHFFIRHLVQPLPALNTSRYSKTALRLRRNYLIVAWGCMTFSFLFALIVTFYQVYVELGA